jgi:hypothetical protein
LQNFHVSTFSKKQQTIMNFNKSHYHQHLALL